MLEQTAEKVPLPLRDTFLLLGWDRIAEAARRQQSCHFMEELMLDTVLLEREAMKLLSAENQPRAQDKMTILKALRVKTS